MDRKEIKCQDSENEAENYEKDLVEKCKDQLKSCYRYIDGKLENKEEMSKLKFNSELYRVPEEMIRVNNCFQSFFTRESDSQCQTWK